MKARFDTSAGGHMMCKKNAAKCNDMFEIFAQTEYEQKSTLRNSTSQTSSTSSKGMSQITSDSGVALALEHLTKELQDIKDKVNRCEFCRGGHETLECPKLTKE